LVLIPSNLSFRQLDGSSIKAAGLGVVVIRPPGASQLLAMWPSYYYPSAPQHNPPLNAINHYLQISLMYMEHALHLCVTVTPAIKLKFSLLPTELAAAGLDYFRAEVVLPPPLSSHRPTEASHLQILPRHVEYSKAPVMTHALMHHIFGHCSEDILDTMCREQTPTGLPRVPPPQYEYDCPVCSLGKLPQFRKRKTASTDNLKPGELMHMDFTFWDITLLRMFTAVLIIIYAKTRMLWLFCTSSKKPPMHILRWFFANLRREKRMLANIRVDEDGDMAGSASFTTIWKPRAAMHPS
jgi:hypothetical protein